MLQLWDFSLVIFLMKNKCFIVFIIYLTSNFFLLQQFIVYTSISVQNRSFVLTLYHPKYQEPTWCGATADSATVIWLSHMVGPVHYSRLQIVFLCYHCDMKFVLEILVLYHWQERMKQLHTLLPPNLPCVENKMPLE